MNATATERSVLLRPDGADPSRIVGLRDAPDAGAQALSASNEELSASEGQKLVPAGCPRWPKRLYLLSSQGLWVPGRCRSSNLCEYCLIQEVHVIRRMLSMQAIDGPAPELLMVFGTRTATNDPAPFYRGRSEVVRALRREFGPVSYACLSEFTTGKSHYSGGLRRPHWNMLVGGVPADVVDQVRELVIPIWCQHVDAEPEAQYAEALRDTAALMRYLADHFTKTDQQPPTGEAWKHKQRFNCSRNYFSPLTRAEARELAWWSLQHDREVVKAQRAGEADPMTVAEEAVDELRSLTWSLERKGTIEPTSRPMRVVRAAVLRGKRWELEAGVTNPPRRAVLAPEGLRRALAGAPSGQPGITVREGVHGASKSTPGGQPRPYDLDFRKEVKHG